MSDIKENEATGVEPRGRTLITGEMEKFES